MGEHLAPPTYQITGVRRLRTFEEFSFSNKDEDPSEREGDNRKESNSPVGVKTFKEKSTEQPGPSAYPERNKSEEISGRSRREKFLSRDTHTHTHIHTYTHTYTHTLK